MRNGYQKYDKYARLRQRFSPCDCVCPVPPSPLSTALFLPSST